MRIFDREGLRARLSSKFVGSTATVELLVNTVLDEIEAALPELLAQARVDLIELAGFKLIAVAEERMKAEREGKLPPTIDQDTSTD